MTARKLLPTLALGIFLGALDMNILALALTRLSVAFDIAQAAVVWVVVAYSAAYMVAMPIVGRLGDLFGRRNAFIGGIVTFTLGSAACAASGWAGNWLWLLLAGRAVQGLGAGGLVPVATAMIGEHIEESRRGKALGVVGMCFGGASILGPILGGVLLDRIGWEWLFAVNLPLGAVALVMALRNLPAGQRSATGRIDWLGGLLLAVALGGFILGAEGVSTNLKELASPFFGWVPQVWGVAAIAAVAFLLWERKAASPMLDLGLYRLGAVRTAFGVSFLYGAGMLIAMVFTPMFFHYRFDFTALQAGLGLLPMAFAVGFASMKGGKLSDKRGPRWVLLLGLSCFALGLGGLAMAAPSAPLVAILGLLVVTGLGFGFCQAPLTHAVLSATDPAQHGQASGAVNTHRSLGGIVGATIGAFFIADAMSRVGMRMLDTLGDRLPPNCLIPRVVDPNHVTEMVGMLPVEVRAEAVATANRIVSEQLVAGLVNLYLLGTGALVLALILAFFLPKAKRDGAIEAVVPAASEPAAHP